MLRINVSQHVHEYLLQFHHFEVVEIQTVVVVAGDHIHHRGTSYALTLNLTLHTVRPPPISYRGKNLISPHHRFFYTAIVVDDDQWNVCSELSFAANKVDNFNDLALRFDG